MATINEIAPDVFRITVYVPEFDLQFNHFLIKDDEPMLYHTGIRQMFPEIYEAVSKHIKPSDIRWIGFSHFEVDECGALNEWLSSAPSAKPFCSLVGALVNLNSYSIRSPQGMEMDEVLVTGNHRFRFRWTPHLPHGWDASVLFEETNKTLFCSDLFHQIGNLEPITDSDIIERTESALVEYQGGPLMDYMPYTTKTKRLLEELAAFEPKTLAIMHGSSFNGDCKQALLDLSPVMEEVFGEK